LTVSGLKNTTEMGIKKIMGRGGEREMGRRGDGGGLAGRL